jgi:hypothetical protein
MSMPTTFEGWVFWSIVALVLFFDPAIWVFSWIHQRCCRHQWSELGFSDPYADTWHRWRRCIKCQKKEQHTAYINDPTTWTFPSDHQEPTP